jgi:D-alanyl-lipoteichoic acid acyltransferase DltB (MBOAT superfamily)
MGANLGLLFFFKYAAWASTQAIALVGIDAPTGWLSEIVLPLGISFYTFQSMSYTIDVYRGELRATRDPLLFFAFLTMFPQLVAGPIVRASDLIGQLETPGAFTAENRWYGLQRIAEGFFLKCVVADNIAPAVDLVFGSDPSLWKGKALWLASILFSLQIYGDFAGYSSIAIGLAAWMGYHFRENFDHPFRATSPQDYLRRWHISLGTWLRDYVYRPIRATRLRAAGPTAAVCLTMLLSGIWHGANWTFVAWGGLYAAGFVVQRAVEASPLPRLVPPLAGLACAWAATFALTLVTRMTFRSPDIDHAWTAWTRMASLAGGKGLALEPAAILGVAAFACIALSRPPREPGPVPRLLSLPVAATFAMLLAAVLLRGTSDAFIYFQF